MVVFACIIIAIQYLNDDAEDPIELVEFFCMVFSLDKDVLSHMLDKLKEAMMAALPGDYRKHWQGRHC